MVEVYELRLPLSSPAATRGVPKLQNQVRVHRRDLLYAGMWRARVGKSRSQGGSPMNLGRIYEYALQRERQGKEFFESNAGRMSHAAAAGIFRRLAAEEERHIQFIQGLLEGVADKTAGTEARTRLRQTDLFSQRAETEMMDQTVIESMIPDVSILRMAYLIERDFAEFYEQAAEQTEGDDKTALAALARWERGHERLFKDLHDRVFQEYSEMPWGG